MADFDPSSDLYQRAKLLLCDVAEKPVAERGVFLDRMCDSDPALRREVESLLKHTQDSGDAFSDAALQRGRMVLRDALAPKEGEDLGAALADAPPVSVGRYEVVGLLGRGGMGVVYEATQENPRRRVAVKVMRPGFFSADAARRFEFEASVLGRLEHPGIAHIYEAGVADVVDASGRTLRQPFFAMECVLGQPLTKYARKLRLDLAQRLALFVELCDAIEYAHRRGVIHRDIKPANVLVTEAGRPKVLDFGVARLTDADLQATTMHTDAARLVGTLSYMSPEQVGERSDQLDTRSDVYSLGVVLYELVTDRLPYDLAGKSITTAARIIEEQSSPTLGTIDRAFRGDLETVVAKALEKDPAGRYGSVGELAGDVRRYLRREPIVARRASAMYQMRMFARRNRALVGGIAATFVVLVMGIVGTSYGLVRAEQRRVEADEQRALAETRADQTRQVADFQAGMLSEINIEEMGRGLRDDFREQVLAGMGREFIGEKSDLRRRTEDELAEVIESFDRAISSANPADVARQVMDKYVLRPAADSLEEELVDQPLVQARIHDAIGMTYCRSLGMFAAAEPHLRSALALRRDALGDDILVAETLMNLAEVQLGTGDLAGGEASCREAVPLLRSIQESESPELATSLDLLSMMLRRQGKLNDSEAVAREALAIAREWPDEGEVLSAALNELGVVLKTKGEYAAAEPLYREAIAVIRLDGGEQHLQVATCLLNLAGLLQAQGKLDAAEPALREALEMRRALLGDEHPKTAMSFRTLGIVLQKKGDLPGAETEIRSALGIYRKTLGEDHADVASCMGDLAKVHEALGEDAEAEALFRKALGIHRRLLGPNHPHVATGLNNLALLLKRGGDLAGAEPLYRDALDLYKSALGEEHPYVAIALANLARLMLQREELDEAQALYEEALAICQERLPPDHRSALVARMGVARILVQRKRFEEAESGFLEITELLDGSSPARLGHAEVAENFVTLYDAWHASEPDQGHDEQAADWRDRLHAAQAAKSQ